MRPVSVFADGPDAGAERLRAQLRGQWRQAARAVMVLLPLHELPADRIAEPLECHPVTVRRWITLCGSNIELRGLSWDYAAW
jgi:hypothetical protein